jgi:hypothetical protein
MSAAAPPWDDQVVDAVARYRDASERNDIAALVDTLAPDIELVSPISGRMVFRGRADVEILLAAVYGSLNGLRWERDIGDDTVRVFTGECKVGPLRLGDAMVVDLARDGRIQRIRPHLRPWLGLTALALVLLPKVIRHPGLVWRALRS